MSRLGVYNGWTGEVRDSRYREYLQARKDGRIGPPVKCEICGQTKGKILHHAEQYGPTLEAYFKSLHALCVYCHGMLHLKKRFPGRWIRHKKMAKVKPFPVVAHMGVVYQAANRWSDIPKEEYVPGDQWWEAI